MSQQPIAIEHRTIRTNGVNLHVALAGPDDGPLVILLHGFPEFWYSWRAQIPYLAEQGYRVMVPDQRGYNLSDKPAGIDAYRLEMLVTDVIGLIDAVERDTVYLVGHDWGAAVAWGVALAHPERLKKLAILNVPHPTVFADTLRTSTTQMFRSIYFGFFQIPRLPELLMTAGDAWFGMRFLLSSSHPRTFSDADIRQYIRAWKQPGAMTGMINWYRAIVQRPPNMPEDPRIHVPTLVIWGAQDVALERSMAQKSVDLCDDGRLVVFEDATHWVQHDKPGEVSALLAEFFEPTA
jgi:pimeloyl-ACP methyl ester carboxylesterase